MAARRPKSSPGSTRARGGRKPAPARRVPKPRAPSARQASRGGRGGSVSSALMLSAEERAALRRACERYIHALPHYLESASAEAARVRGILRRLR